jgi:hypothetical protein
MGAGSMILRTCVCWYSSDARASLGSRSMKSARCFDWAAPRRQLAEKSGAWPRIILRTFAQSSATFRSWSTSWPPRFRVVRAERLPIAPYWTRYRAFETVETVSTFDSVRGLDLDKLFAVGSTFPYFMTYISRSIERRGSQARCCRNPSSRALHAGIKVGSGCHRMPVNSSTIVAVAVDG